MTWRSFPHMHNSWKKNSIQKSSTGLCVHFAGYAEIPHALQGSRSLILHVVSSQSSDHGVDFSTGICLLSACKVCWVWTSSSLLSQLAALPLIPRQTPEKTWLELTSKHRWTWDSLQIIHRFTRLSHSLKSEFLTKFKAKKIWCHFLLKIFLSALINIPKINIRTIWANYKLHWKQCSWTNHSNINF